MSDWNLRVPDLDTPRLVLRPLRADDAEALHRWQSDPVTTEYLPYAPRTLPQVQAFIARFAGARELWHDHDRVVLAAVRRDDDAVIGELHLVVRRHEVREVELGWVFDPDATGLGYATEAAQAARDVVLRGGAHRVVAELDPRNDRSARLCARLGMREEARFRADFPTPDGWLDTAIWALVEGDPLP